MTNSKRLISIVIVLFGLMLYAGCDNNDNDSTSTGEEITKSANLVYLNYTRNQLVLDDGYTVNIIPGTFIARQRPSCSGFEEESIYEYELGDMVEYTYINDDTVDYANRMVDAIALKAWTQDCLNPEDDIQHLIYVDTDKDFIPDIYDNCPTTPNNDQADSNGNGIGDVCE